MSKRAPEPVARFLGPKNAEAVVGHPWRWCRDHARAWGIQLLTVDRKTVIPAEPFFAALEAHAVGNEGRGEATELEAMRDRVRRAGSPQSVQ
jgi:hypothetical protein